MKTVYPSLLITVILLFTGLSGFSTSYTWTGATSSAWNVNSNWSPSTGYPGSADNATIVSASNNPVYTTAGIAEITNLTITSGTLDLNGFTLNVTSVGTFTAGTVTNGVINADTATSFVFEGTLMDCKVTGLSQGIRIYNTTFNDTIAMKKNGSSNNSSNGLNKFMDFVSLTNSGTGYLRMGVLYPDTFYGEVSLTSEGNYISIAQSSSGTLFKDDIKVKCKTGTALYFGINTTSGITLESGNIITVDTFSTGILRFEGFTQDGSTAQNITLTGDASLYLYRSSFDGALTTVSPRVFGRESIFNAACSFTKNGSGDDSWNGHNLFNQEVVLNNNAGSGDDLRYATQNPDTFYDKVTINANSGPIILAYSYVGDTTLLADTLIVNPGLGYISHLGRWGDIKFEKDVIVGETSSEGSLYFGYSGGSAVFANGARLKLGSAGYTGGTLLLRDAHFSTGSPEELTLSSSAILNIDSSNFNCVVDFVSPRILCSYSTFNDTSYFEKTAGSNDPWVGANTFNEHVEFTNSSTSNLTLANTDGDDFNSSLVLNKTSTGSLNPAYNDTSTFAGSIQINSDGTISFNSSSGLSVLDGNGDQTILGSATGVTFKELEVDKTGGMVILSKDIAITDTLRFTEGIIESNEYAVIVNSLGAVLGAHNESHVSGKVDKKSAEDFTYPLGAEQKYYRLKYVNLNSHQFDTEVTLDKSGNTWRYTIKQ